MVRRADQATTTAAELVEAAEHVARSGKRRVVRALGKPLAIVPLATLADEPKRRAKPFTMKDPLWEIRGIVDGPGPTDVAANKDRYLAEAYAV